MKRVKDDLFHPPAKPAIAGFFYTFREVFQDVNRLVSGRCGRSCYSMTRKKKIQEAGCGKPKKEILVTGWLSVVLEDLKLYAGVIPVSCP